MTYCKVSQADIYYEDRGEGTPILMIHGYSPDHRLMSGCMEPVFRKRTGWRRIYMDLPGMGLTKNYQDIGSSDDMLQTVLEFVQKVLPDQDFLIAGESYGGYLARGIIEKQRSRVHGAAFICPCIVPQKEKRRLPEHVVLRSDHEFLKNLTDDELEDFSSMQVVLDEYNWNRYQHEILTGCAIADEPFLEKVKKNYAFSFDIDQSEFDQPTLFLLGRQDASVGFKDALDLIDKYPRGTFGVLDTAGHNLQIEQSQIFNTLINDWLDRVE
ncbi:alpha/beta hydrolase [Sporolactobacillus shoreae]|uniref:Alpha/beta hydrolase n=1 Tax=Sporolactobacillus shoreae TaxID=1465501 RepID=A0A4Z0GN09_9BACL|nr:alpha/beta hydrolase [Sporolactobacillus shoreae]TGA98454.1 alpha/beta hydrolase [Sporolactobacillus shoreae]